MAEQTETRGSGFFIASEANGTLSRDVKTIKLGEDLAVGQVLGTITASGKLVAVDPAAVDGSEVASGILYNATDATAADTEAVVITRDAEVKKDELIYGTVVQLEIDAIDAQLLALQIKVLA